MISTLLTISLLLGQISTAYGQAPISPIEVSNKEIPAPEVKVPVIAILSEKTALSPVIEGLSKCESGGRDDIRILDVNGKYSYGFLQFQLGTFHSFGKKYGVFGGDTTPDQALKFIYSKDTQVQIAEKMLNDGLAYHWKNCATKIGIL